MQLADFLKTVPDLSDEAALEAAKSFQEITGQLIDATTINGILTDFKLIGVLVDAAHDKTHPARDICLGVYTGLLGGHPFNIIQNSLTGQRALAQLNWLISTGLPEHAVALSQFRDLVMWRANVVSYPFKDITLYDVMSVRGTCPRVSITSDDGWAVITTTSDAPEEYRPQLKYLNPRTEKIERATNFPLITVAGRYECQVPSFAFGNELYVDNPYGVM